MFDAVSLYTVAFKLGGRMVVVQQPTEQNTPNMCFSSQINMLREMLQCFPGGVFEDFL